MHFKRLTRGFTLLELMVSMTLGVIVLGSSVSMFVQALKLSNTVNDKAEMQQNARASLDLIDQDISQAGAGLPTGGVQLPTGVGASKLGCDQTTTCYLFSPFYPDDNVITFNRFYGIVPSNQGGLSFISSGSSVSTVRPDAISIARVDTGFGLQWYTPTFNGGGNASIATPNPSVTFTFTAPVPPPNPLPNPWPPAPINDPQVGLQVGDLVLFTNGGSAIGEVTSVSGNIVTFADGDKLLINQSTALSGNLAANLATITTGPPQVITVQPLTCYRVLMITYFVDVPPGSNTARLMRQVNGHPPVPVAEDISGLSFTYDLFNENTNLQTWKQATVPDPNQIRSVNVQLTTRAPLSSSGGYQAVTLSSTVSARNLSFQDRYQ